MYVSDGMSTVISDEPLSVFNYVVSVCLSVCLFVSLFVFVCMFVCQSFSFSICVSLSPAVFVVRVLEDAI